MLARLQIQNYAIIDEVSIAFPEGLTTITGETGAGKSILVGALSLILGRRADTGVLYDKSRKCIVEGEFDISTHDLASFFERHDLDHEPVTLVRREISRQGRSRAFVNDTPVTLDVLRDLAARLVDVHAQHESLALADASFHLDVIDALAGHQKAQKEYHNCYTQWQQAKSDLEERRSRSQQAQADLDYLQFQLDELEKADLQAGEQEKLEAELESLTHAEDIKRTLLEAVAVLGKNEQQSVEEMLREVLRKVREAARHNRGIEALHARLESVQIELSDIVNELEAVEQETVYDEERIAAVNERIDMLYKLQQKHGVASVDELLEVQEKLQQKLDETQQRSGDISALEKQVNELFASLCSQADHLSKARKNQVSPFEKSVNGLLSDVGMPYARIRVEHEQLPDEALQATGRDKLRFGFSPDKGKNFRPLHKIASGGERSRLMLCIKSLIARHMTLPTIIFDEIDTGISGEVAGKVGRILQTLAGRHQVICITHLPQIASKGDAHYYVYKTSEGDRTATRLRTLSGKDRTLEIARMLSGEQPSKGAVANARELLKETKG